MVKFVCDSCSNLRFLCFSSVRKRVPQVSGSSSKIGLPQHVYVHSDGREVRGHLKEKTKKIKRKGKKDKKIKIKEIGCKVETMDLNPFLVF